MEYNYVYSPMKYHFPHGTHSNAKGEYHPLCTSYVLHPLKGLEPSNQVLHHYEPNKSF